VIGADFGAVQQAEHGEGAQPPHRGGAGGQIPDQSGWGDGDLEQGGQGDGGDQQQLRQPQDGLMAQPLGLQHADLHDQGMTAAQARQPL